jgi:serine/threonine protein kinase
MQHRNEGEDGALLLRVGVEFGYLTPEHVKEVYARQAQLQQGGIDISIGQTLLERGIIRSSEYRRMAKEVEAQRVTRKPRAPIVPAKKTFGHYELLEILSEHGHCRVLKARDTTLDRLVVLKVLPSSLARDTQWSERFSREVQLAGKLSHPNIVITHGAGEIDGNPLMVLEWVEGLSLGERLERLGCLPELEAWSLAREVAKGLAYAGKHNILHRDIKPDNLLCGPDGMVKIIDMGLSKSMTDNSGLTVEGTTVGTPFYISPEQSRSTRDLDARADIYSLGCTVYHALTGIVPFLGEQVMDVMVSHIHSARPDPREYLPELSEASARLVMRMMAIDPANRPPNAEALLAEIENLISGLTVSVPPPPPTRRPMVPPPPTRNLAVPPPPPTRNPSVPPPPTRRPMVAPQSSGTPKTNRPTVAPPHASKPDTRTLAQKASSAPRIAPVSRVPARAGRAPVGAGANSSSPLDRLSKWVKGLFR